MSSLFVHPGDCIGFSDLIGTGWIRLGHRVLSGLLGRKSLKFIWIELLLGPHVRHRAATRRMTGSDLAQLAMLERPLSETGLRRRDEIPIG